MRHELERILSTEFYPTDKFAYHSYIAYFYEREFLKYKNNPITLLEIGVYQGGSIRLWHDYFDNAEIYCIDTIHRNGDFYNFCGDNKINYLIRDAYNIQSATLIPELDIFIDDGPNTLESQLLAITLYLPKIKPGGLFIIEDIEIDNYERLRNHAVSLYNAKNIELVDLRIVRYLQNDLLMVIRK